MNAATLFHLVGTGKDDTGKLVSFDIHFGTHKTDGSITQNGEKIELINPGAASVYFRAPDELWQHFGGAGDRGRRSGTGRTGAVRRLPRLRREGEVDLEEFDDESPYRDERRESERLDARPGQRDHRGY
ncbi:MAG TPA: hypothetical protein VGJ59_14270 [Jatrophihabitantaceae bacterium]|jgi:hypothetical protein